MKYAHQPQAKTRIREIHGYHVLFQYTFEVDEVGIEPPLELSPNIGFLTPADCCFLLEVVNVAGLSISSF